MIFVTLFGYFLWAVLAALCIAAVMLFIALSIMAILLGMLLTIFFIYLIYVLIMLPFRGFRWVRKELTDFYRDVFMSK